MMFKRSDSPAVGGAQNHGNMVTALGTPTKTGSVVFDRAALELTFDETLEQAVAVDAIELLDFGADGLPGGGDDVPVPLASAAATGDQLSIHPSSELDTARYQLTIGTSG